jgi:hypothetical protein
MNPRIHARLLPILLLVMLACAPPKVWERVEVAGQRTLDGSFTVDLPIGWVRALGYAQSLVITKDGTPIQEITISCLPQEKAFPATKRTLPGDALPSDVAAQHLAELRSNPGLANMTVSENAPATVAGEAGFKLHVEWRNAQGARYDGLIYGVLIRGKLLTLTYMALHLNFFPRDLPEFEKVLASCRPAAAPK